jgi:hypothetical protein
VKTWRGNKYLHMLEVQNMLTQLLLLKELL